MWGVEPANRSVVTWASGPPARSLPDPFIYTCTPLLPDRRASVASESRHSGDRLGTIGRCRRSAFPIGCVGHTNRCCCYYWSTTTTACGGSSGKCFNSLGCIRCRCCDDGRGYRNGRRCHACRWWQGRRQRRGCRNDGGGGLPPRPVPRREHGVVLPPPLLVTGRCVHEGAAGVITWRGGVLHRFMLAPPCGSGYPICCSHPFPVHLPAGSLLAAPAGMFKANAPQMCECALTLMTPLPPSTCLQAPYLLCLQACSRPMLPDPPSTQPTSLQGATGEGGARVGSTMLDPPSTQPTSLQGATGEEGEYGRKDIRAG